MDDFKKAGQGIVGIGGIKCPCCFSYRCGKRGGKKKPGFSKLRRTRFKRATQQIIENPDG